MQCPNCGTTLPKGTKFCMECGEKQGPSRRQLFSSTEIAEIQQESQPDEYSSRLRNTIRDGLQIECRDIAVMFVDVSGFSSMFSSLSADELRRVMRAVYSVMSEVIARHDGYVDKFIGDEVMAVFGAPIALEHPCQRAITVADEMAIALAGVSQRFRHVLSAPLMVHAGIAFGNVQAGSLGEAYELQYTFLGETVNIAKRLTDMATPGTVLVDKKTQLRAEDEFEFISLGEIRLAGVQRLVETFRLIGPRSIDLKSPGLSRLGAPMIGRQVEFDSLRESFDSLAACYPELRPCDQGKSEYLHISRIFGVTGDAGIGKSRLVLELKAYLQRQLGRDKFRWLVGSGWNIGRTPPYLPLKMQIASALGFDVGARRDAISSALSVLLEKGNISHRAMPYLYDLFGLEYPESPLEELNPKSIRDNLWMSLRRLYAHWSFEKPLVLVFEDMQWSDGGTAEFVDYLADFISDFPVIVVLIYRQGYTSKLVKEQHSAFTEMRLCSLSRDAEKQLLDFYVHSGQEEQALLRRLRRYSEGNPLFVEEFLLMLQEQGKLIADNGKMRLVGDVGEIALPRRLADILGARYDKLPRRDKRVAYYGAVIGGTFPYSLLSFIHDALHGVADVGDALNSLLVRDIILKIREMPELEYIFKHAIAREILVSRLIQSLKSELSKLIAARIEECYEDQLDQFHGMLSEHWETAGDIEKAARHAALWGIFNRKQQQNFDAQAAFERYDHLCESFPRCPLSALEEKDLLLSRIAVFEELGRWDTAIGLCKHLADLDDGRYLGAALCKEARLWELKGDWDNSLSLAQRANEAARKTGDRRIEAASLRAIGIVHDQRGQWDLAIKCFEQSIEINRALNNRYGIASSSVDMGIVHSNLGEYDQAIRCLREALDIYRELGDRRNIAITLQASGAVYYQLGDLGRALEDYERAMLTCRELGSRRGLAVQLLNIGLVHSDRGDFDTSLESFDEALKVFRELGDQTGIGSALNNLALAYADTNQWPKAKEAAQEAESINRATGSKAFLSDSLALLCRAEAATGNWESAIASGEEARAIADEVRNLEQIVISRLALSEAYIQAAEYYVDDKQGHNPETCLDDAINKATDYAEQARDLADSKGMGGYVEKANRLLARIRSSSD
ncbi:MAG: tetratricopeptide repeat protein [Candidatus Coatesbacteria bacterium]|nr:tetratricopeptide repeat protein [Candidatus Coatesbacteria bacterium]